MGGRGKGAGLGKNEPPPHNSQSNSGRLDFLGQTQSDSSEEEEQSQQTRDSQSNGGESSELDFLGRPPTNPSDSSEEDEEEEEHDIEQSSPPRQPTRISDSRRPRKQAAPKKHMRISGNRRPRKRAAPKKRKNHILKDINRLRNSTKLQIPKLPFQRVVREVLCKLKNDFRVQQTTLKCLQEAAESYLVELFEDSYMCCLHRSRQTLADKDTKLVQVLRGPNEAGRR